MFPNIYALALWLHNNQFEADKDIYWCYNSMSLDLLSYQPRVVQIWTRHQTAINFIPERQCILMTQISIPIPTKDKPGIEKSVSRLVHWITANNISIEPIYCVLAGVMLLPHLMIRNNDNKCISMSSDGAHKIDRNLDDNGISFGKRAHYLDPFEQWVALYITDAV